jgi:hypothetical protein
MHVVRVYTGEDGRSHFEDLEVPLDESRYGRLSAPVALESVVFRETDPGGELGLHNAPRRQFVVTLSGVVEIECGDGTKRRLGPGDILLADDVTGEGHITREIEGPRKSLLLPLAGDFDPAAWRAK